MEDNRDIITYDEGWQSVSESEAPVIIEPAPVNDNTEPKPIKPPKQLLLTVQLVLCLLIALAAFVLKSIGGELYQSLREWYFGALSNTAIFDGRNESDLSILTEKATSDEV